MRCVTGAVGVVVALGLSLVPRVALAGRSDYGWLFGTDVMPERGVELQSWMYEKNDVAGSSSTNLWWAPVIGITDRLELSLPLELAGPNGGPLELADYGIDLRYRFVSADPVESGPVIPVLRAAVKRDYLGGDGVLTEADAIVGYEQGRVHALVDLGGTGVFDAHSHQLDLRPGAGVSIRLVGGLRAGAEVFADVRLHGGDDEIPAMYSASDYTWVAAGPNAAWTYGRFWVSGSYGIGIYQIHNAPRVQWGIAF